MVAQTKLKEANEDLCLVKYTISEIEFNKFGSNKVELFYGMVHWYKHKEDFDKLKLNCEGNLNSLVVYMELFFKNF